MEKAFPPCLLEKKTLHFPTSSWMDAIDVFGDMLNEDDVTQRMRSQKKEGPAVKANPLICNGEPWRIRTSDPLIKSQLLYQLS
jgi:hypothetical protein